ncbi:MAG: hypothetical protein KGN76_04985 [Acidobacteriota bacterium]|nr:hypothetical protein [Acidobacteriota bacterium]
MKPAASLALAVAALVAAGSATGLAAALDALAFQVTPPAVVMDFDGHTLKGDPVQLAWSATPGEFYIQTVEGVDRDATFRHYTVTLGDKAPRSVKSEPAWASQYWAWKSTRNTPTDPDLLIQVETEVEKNRIPIQSLADKARGMESGGGGIALQGAMVAATDSAFALHVRTLRLKGQFLGQFRTGPLLPGLTFGWSPQPLHAVAFVEKNGDLGIYDYLLNRHQTVAGAKNVLLPAWSPDGQKIVFLVKTGKKGYTLEQVNVTRP